MGDLKARATTPGGKGPATSGISAGHLRFPNEMASLLYACGDEPGPRPDTTSLLEAMTLDYVSAVVQSAAAIAVKGKLTAEEIKWVLRKDSRKRNRIEELERMNVDIKRAKRVLQVENGEWGNE